MLRLLFLIYLACSSTLSAAIPRWNGSLPSFPLSENRNHANKGFRASENKYDDGWLLIHEDILSAEGDSASRYDIMMDSSGQSRRRPPFGAATMNGQYFRYQPMAATDLSMRDAAADGVNRAVRELKQEYAAMPEALRGIARAFGQAPLGTSWALGCGIVDGTIQSVSNNIRIWGDYKQEYDDKDYVSANHTAYYQATRAVPDIILLATGAAVKRHAARGAAARASVPNSSIVSRIQGKLDLYPQVIDPRTGRNIPFPSRIQGRVPKANRVPPLGAQGRGQFIREWYDRGYSTPRGGWNKYDIHHIQPREFGGTNAFWNLAPVERGVHQSQFNAFWREFTEL